MFDRAAVRGIVMPSEPGSLHQVLRAGGAPNADPEARKKVLAAMPRHEASTNNWLHFDFCNQFLQSRVELESATADLVEREFKEDNAVVIEIRFAPVLHCLEGLSVEEVVAAVVAGCQKGVQKCTDAEVGQVIIGGVIICAMRTYPADHGVEMAELAHRWLGRGVIGWDLAADEGAHPLEKHLQGLRRAIELGVPTTVHAGEWGSGLQSKDNPQLFTQPGHHDTLPNIALAINEGCLRLGHALTLFLDPALLNEVAEKRVVVECCLTSNVKRIEGYHAHPITTMLSSGCLCTLNSDNRFLSNTTSTLEILHAVNDVGLT
jgi:adenosine deaminase